jgi:hypothetical protein
MLKAAESHPEHRAPKDKKTTAARGVSQCSVLRHMLFHSLTPHMMMGMVTLLVAISGRQGYVVLSNLPADAMLALPIELIAKTHAGAIFNRTIEAVTVMTVTIKVSRCRPTSMSVVVVIPTIARA